MRQQALSSQFDPLDSSLDFIVSESSTHTMDKQVESLTCSKDDRPAVSCAPILSESQNEGPLRIPTLV